MTALTFSGDPTGSAQIAAGLWDLPALPRPCGLAQARIRALVDHLHTTTDPASRAGLLEDLAAVYDHLAATLTRHTDQRTVLQARAALVRVAAATQHQPSKGWNLAPVAQHAAGDWDTWTRLARTSDHLDRADLLHTLYDNALTADVPSGAASVLLALAVLETTTAELTLR